MSKMASSANAWTRAEVNLPRFDLRVGPRISGRGHFRHTRLLLIIISSSTATTATTITTIYYLSTSTYICSFVDSCLADVSCDVVLNRCSKPSTLPVVGCASDGESMVIHRHFPLASRGERASFTGRRPGRRMLTECCWNAIVREKSATCGWGMLCRSAWMSQEKNSAQLAS